MTTIQVANQIAFEKISKMMLGLDLFKKFTIVEHHKTYPDSQNPIDHNHISVVVEGREKDIHAFRALAWLSYHCDLGTCDVDQPWKP